MLAPRDGWFEGRQFYEPHVSHVSTRKAGVFGIVRGRHGRRLILLDRRVRLQLTLSAL